MLYTVSIKASSFISKLLLVGVVLLCLFTAFRGLAFPDEGYIVNTGQRILDGQVIYRDFDFVYTPLTALATALSFLFWGSSIFAERVLSLLLSLLTIYFLIRLGKFLTNHSAYYLLPATIYLLLLSVGLWSALFFGYYRWSPPLITQNTLTNHPRIGIWTDTATKQQIETVSALLNAYSKPGEEVFLNYYSPMVYFLTERRNPTRYDYIGLPESYQQELIQTLGEKKIRTIVTFYINKNNTSVIGKFIRENYIFAKKSGEYEVWRVK